MVQIIGITCDNAAPNDVMMEHLRDDLPAGFAGPPGRARCFDHIVNLVAKSLLKLFDDPKKKRNTRKKGSKKGKEKAVEEESDDEEEGEKEPDNNPIDVEDLLAQLKDMELGTPEKDDPDDVFDELATMTEEAKEKFFGDVKAVSKALSKVCALTLSSIELNT